MFSFLTLSAYRGRVHTGSTGLQRQRVDKSHLHNARSIASPFGRNSREADLLLLVRGARRDRERMTEVYRVMRLYNNTLFARVLSRMVVVNAGMMRPAPLRARI